mmetsp:Transcript_24690/g.51664  ORF Transcript_24690/g.51664 Transcript_24690/m.51664 type:complete len:294 (-) Transcript_24690:256-1137(-)
MPGTHQGDLRHQLPPPRDATPQQRQGRHRPHLRRPERRAARRPEVRGARSRRTRPGRARSDQGQDEGSADDATGAADPGAGMRVRGSGGEGRVRRGEREARSGVFDQVEDGGSVASGAARVVVGGSPGSAALLLRTGPDRDDDAVVPTGISNPVFPRPGLRHLPVVGRHPPRARFRRGIHLPLRPREEVGRQAIFGGARPASDVHGVPSGAQRAHDARGGGGGGELRRGERERGQSVREVHVAEEESDQDGEASEEREEEECVGGLPVGVDEDSFVVGGAAGHRRSEGYDGHL